jgi:phosphohistidine phosphatase SixA
MKRLGGIGSMRLLVAILALVLTLAQPAAAQMDERAAWAALGDGAIVLFRHANAPGTGDPANFRLGDCATQRNLDDAGRAQARRIGVAFAGRGIPVGRVLTSEWCRARDTAALAFPGRAEDAPAFNSFFDDRSRAAAQTAEAAAILRDWRGPGVLVVVTHMVNIAELAGYAPAEGEGVVLRDDGGRFVVVGTILP